MFFFLVEKEFPETKEKKMTKLCQITKFFPKVLFFTVKIKVAIWNFAKAGLFYH